MKTWKKVGMLLLSVGVISVVILYLNHNSYIRDTWVEYAGSIIGGLITLYVLFETLNENKRLRISEVREADMNSITLQINDLVKNAYNYTKSGYLYQTYAFTSSITGNERHKELLENLAAFSASYKMIIHKSAILNNKYDFDALIKGINEFEGYIKSGKTSDESTEVEVDKLLNELENFIRTNS